MKNRKLWIGIITLVVVVGLMGWLWLSSQEQPNAGGKAITITVVHGDGSEKMFSYGTDAKYLGEVILEEQLAEGEKGPYGLEIHTVDGETASWEKDQSYWALYIGTEYATTGADSVILTDGGEYSLVYTRG